MIPRLPTIHMFWMGERLSTLERLSMRSFRAHGHHVRLWSYTPFSDLPAGVEASDAGGILPRTFADPWIRSGVPAAYLSEAFRHAVLAREGGIWSDADVVCLKPFVFDAPILVGREDDRLLGSCVLGFPAGHEAVCALAAAAARPWAHAPWDDTRTALLKRMGRVRYVGRPLAALRALRWGAVGHRTVTPAFAHYGLMGYALPPSAFCPIPYTRMVTILDGEAKFAALTDSYAVHLWSALWGIHGVGRDETRASGCLLEQLKEVYL